MIGGADDVAKKFRVIVPRRDWLKNPWDGLDPADHPDQWDERIPIVVLPEEPDHIHARLGEWLKAHVAKRRNTVRFLISNPACTNAFLDRDLLILARAVVKADEWRNEGSEYSWRHGKYQGESSAAFRVKPVDSLSCGLLDTCGSQPISRPTKASHLKRRRKRFARWHWSTTPSCSTSS